MKNKVLFASVLAFPLIVAAQDGEADGSGTYARFGAGIAIVEDIEGFVDTVFEPRLDYELNLDPGVRVDFAPGYNFNHYFGVELNTGFVWNSIDSIELEDGRRGRAEGDLLQIPMMGSVVLRVPTPIQLTPFVGAGAGGAYVRLENDDSDEAGDDFFAAFQFFGGVKYEIDEVLSVGMVYKYMHVFSEDEETIFTGESAGLGDLTTHSISAIVSFNF
ncbi:MAG TPA: outer membrane beta-barrel protein [Verrucomicrobiae bacterium]